VLHDDAPWVGSAALQTASATKADGYRIGAAPKTVFNLGRNRNGCVLTSTAPAQTVCNIAVAFPDVGLDGTVIFSSTGVPTAGKGLTISRRRAETRSDGVKFAQR